MGEDVWQALYLPNPVDSEKIGSDSTQPNHLSVLK